MARFSETSDSKHKKGVIFQVGVLRIMELDSKHSIKQWLNAFEGDAVLY
jgi:hypothetical protein